MDVSGGRTDSGVDERRPETVLAGEGLSSPSSRVRLAAYALEYVAGLVASDFSWCAAAGAGGLPDLTRPVVCRPGAGSRIEASEFVRDYQWLGFGSDPFRLGSGTDSQVTVRSVDELGGPSDFAQLPFAVRFLGRHGLATRTVVYLRERGAVRSVIALDRSADEPAPDRHERVSLIRVAPLLGQALGAAGRLDLVNPGSTADRVPGLTEIGELTRREEQIARMIARGLGTDEIAQELTLSRGTVKVHLGHLYAKAGVSTRAELVGLLLGRGGGE